MNFIVKVTNNERNIYDESFSVLKWILLPSACLLEEGEDTTRSTYTPNQSAQLILGVSKNICGAVFLYFSYLSNFFFLLIVLKLQKAPYQVTIKLYVCSAWPCSLFTKKYYSSQFELISYPFLHWRRKLVRNKKCRWTTYFIHYSFICSFFRQK